MPSFRSILLIAAASFVALTSAAPTGLVSRAGVDPLSTDTPLSGLNIAGVVDKATSTVQGVKPLALSGRDELQSLPVILTAAKQKLTAVSDNLSELSFVRSQCTSVKVYTFTDATIAGMDVVGIDTVTPFIGQCHEVLVEILASVKLLIGHPDEIVLGVTGTVQDVAELLSAVLSVRDDQLFLRLTYSAIAITQLLAGILASILKSVGATAADVVKPLIQAIGALLLELIPHILSLVQGLSVILASALGVVLNLLSDLGLGDLITLLSAI
ncbi:hypothetical protein C0991_004006 [Blastosporella zonata]|nr:hypothetical protein C0991_004006 [Blastosporella zonata]